nr:putative protein phosphatase 2c 47 [Quercus suber]
MDMVVAHAFLNASSLDSSSGTTTLIALITGRTMLIANVGDSQAVLGKQGRAIELSKDHKPNCTAERLRIENLGGSKSPLSFELELEEILLSEEDEFLIIGCDGLWDVMSSQCAVTMVRKELIMHNDPDSPQTVAATLPPLLSPISHRRASNQPHRLTKSFSLSLSRISNLSISVFSSSRNSTLHRVLGGRLKGCSVEKG